ncbi:hypothetical protein ACTSEZ_09525 [Metabacillus sp. JX24]|uniref:hypothetical protein n=1 Tax=Metabacillus sp. JX24 TaxID=3240759 RepID=UPI00350EFF73
MLHFKDSPDTMVITIKQIMDRTQTVLYVSHDKEDGMWQFLDGSMVFDTDDARIVTLEEMIEIDDSLASISDLPHGWIAERDDRKAIWKRRKKQ